jgi:hypothetical protein
LGFEIEILKLIPFLLKSWRFYIKKAAWCLNDLTLSGSKLHCVFGIISQTEGGRFWWSVLIMQFWVFDWRFFGVSDSFLIDETSINVTNQRAEKICIWLSRVCGDF